MTPERLARIELLAFVAVLPVEAHSTEAIDDCQMQDPRVNSLAIPCQAAVLHLAVVYGFWPVGFYKVRGNKAVVRDTWHVFRGIQYRVSEFLHFVAIL